MAVVGLHKTDSYNVKITRIWKNLDGKVKVIIGQIINSKILK